MSAIDLRKVNGDSSGTHTCDIDGCIRKGRFALSIAGHPVPAQSRLAMGSQARLCKPCAESFLSMWSEFNGSRHEEETMKAIAALAGSPAERAEAVFTLRDLGYSAEVTARAVAHTGRGRSVEEIIAALDDPGLEEAA